MTQTLNDGSAQKKPLSVFHLLLALFAGAVIFLGFSPYSLWYVSFAGILIFLCLQRVNRKAKDYFFLAMAFHLGMFAAGVHWIYVSIHTHGQVPAFLSVLFLGGFASLIALLSSLPWLLFPYVANNPNSRLFVFPAIWVLGEWLRGWLLTGFPWLYMGQTHLNTPLAGWTPVIGVLGTGFMIAVTAVALVSIFTQRKPLVVLAQSLIIVSVWSGGSILNKVEWTTPVGPKITATLIQPNIELSDKWNPAKASGIIKVLETESAPYWDERLLIWPEAALPYVGENAQSFMDDLGNEANLTNTALISGYLTYDDEERRYYNAIGGTGLATGEYLKQRLVPFGEYVPMESWLRGIMHFFDLPMSIISKGASDQSGLKFSQSGHQYTVAPAICYEIAYAPLVAELARESNLIVTLSNDAWFGDSIGPWQHVEIAQVRALENRKPVLRVTNTGVTASISHRGKILNALPQFEPGALNTEIQAMSGTTPFSVFKNWPLLGVAALVVILTAIFCRFKRQSRD